MKLIKVTAIWCVSCLIMNDRINKLKDKYKLDICDLDYDINREEIKYYNIGTKLPVIILIDENNKEISRLVGEKTKKELGDFIEKNI